MLSKRLKVELHLRGGGFRDIITPWRKPEYSHSVEKVLSKMLGSEFDDVDFYNVTEIYVEDMAS